MSRPLHRWVFGFLLIVIGCSVAVRAQTPSLSQSFFSQTGTSAEEDFGTVVSGAGDADGDSLGDFLVGSDSLLQVYGGDTGRFLYAIRADRTGDFLRARALPVEDLDNDGRADLVVAAPFADVNGMPDAGAVFIFSGINGRLIKRIDGQAARGYFGASVAFLKDATDDGFPGLAVGAPLTAVDDAADTGVVSIVSLKDGSILRTIPGAIPGGQFGSALAEVGDITNDGLTDFAAGAPLADFQGRPGAGGVFFVSGGKNGRILGSPVPGSGPDAHFGASLANAGDVNGDGQTDLIIGQPGANVNDLVGAGNVIVYSRRGGQELQRLLGSAAGDGFGAVVAGNADFNGDGHPDILVGTPQATVNGLSRAGRAQVFSSVDRQLLLDIWGKNAGDLLGFAAAFAGDVTGDGRADVVIGAPRFDTGVSNAGLAIAYSRSGV